MLKITLWGDHALNFNINDIYDPEAGNLIVCLIVGCLPRQDFTDNGNTLPIAWFIFIILQINLTEC
jgi:hypothetical protein